MAIHDKIRDEKLQYRISREAAKIPLLSSGNAHKYKYITGEEYYIQSQMIERSRFKYTPLHKTFEKQIEQLKIKVKSKQSFRAFKFIFIYIFR